MGDVNKKYLIDTDENKKFLEDVRNGLLPYPHTLSQHRFLRVLQIDIMLFQKNSAEVFCTLHTSHLLKSQIPASANTRRWK